RDRWARRASVDAHYLPHRPGIGAAEAATLLAAREVACRLAKEVILDRELLDRPAAVSGYLSLRYGRTEQEIMGVLFLDVRNRLIGEMEIYRGTIHRLSVEPRAILKSALLRGAWGILLFHALCAAAHKACYVHPLVMLSWEPAGP
ncbi:MAG: hypothetical protein HC897_19485, partial [Thermoanaerobaculia bacterium]|nr:hypothetical protein [Thermoanaerobaculia bacterium]